MPTTLPTWLQVMLFLASPLLGGLGSALHNAIRTKKSETMARRAAFLEAQLQKVYGPVHMHLLEIQRLLSLNVRYRETGLELQKQREQSWLNKDEHLGTELENDVKATWNLTMETLGQVKSKNRAILEILHNNAAHVDADDLSLVVDLFEDVTRADAEADGKFHRLKLSENAFKILSFPTALRPNLVSNFEARYLHKTAELAELRGASARKRQWWRRLIPRRRSNRKQAA